MARHDRLLHILSLLKTRRVVTVSELARECEVTPRTIYRDIDTISSANYPIYFDGGYRLLPTAALPPPQFTPEEQSLLQSALDSWPLANTPAYRATLKRIQAKIESWQEAPPKPARPILHVRPRTSQDRVTDPRLFAALEQAIAASQRVEMKYDAITSGLSARRVDPYLLVFRGRAFYLVGWCHSKNAVRLFRVGRIRSLKVTAETFARDPALSAERLFRDSWEVYLGAPFEATVRLTGNAARIVAGARRHPSERFVQKDPRTLIYSVTVNSIEEFGRWVLGFGGEARVLAPDSLARWVKRHARGILAAYRSA